ncbi:MAG TPA: TRAP transporter substrate-binding protein DctP [Candidatus Binatia bacterium]|nr:TRAP transporter substrate-binding protein DctP [Candidatus Binatia bacterium]
MTGTRCRRVLGWLAVVLVALGGQAGAAEVEWKFFTYFPTNDKPAALNRAFADDVFKASQQRFKITVFAAGELPYKAPDVIKAVANNQVQMGDVAVGFAAGDVPEVNVFSLPFLCTSYEGFHRALPEVAPVVDELLLRKVGVRVLVHWTMPPQNLWLNRPVATLDDLKGLKVRTWNPQQVEALRLLQVASVSITSAEVVPALERRVIDGAITSALSANDWKAYDIVKNGYLLNLTMGHQVLMVNEGEFRRLPADLARLLTAKAAEWAPRYRQMSEDGDRAARESLTRHGVVLREPSATDLTRARALMRPMWDSWAERHAPIGRELLAKAGACTR